MKNNFLGLPEGGSCDFLLFPGCKFCEYEPSIVVKLYDSIRFQKPDTGILIRCCKDEEMDLSDIWLSAGKPAIITTCPGCLKNLRDTYPEITFVSVYEVLTELGIGGGCNSVGYNIYNPAAEYYDEKSAEAVKSLSLDMGVKLQAETAAGAPLPDNGFPFITQSILSRNKLIEKGLNAAHILELIYGMGELNSHLVHEHHDHEEHESEEPECPPPAPVGVAFPDSAALDASRRELIDILQELYGFENAL